MKKKEYKLTFNYENGGSTIIYCPFDVNLNDVKPTTAYISEAKNNTTWINLNKVTSIIKEERT